MINFPQKPKIRDGKIVMVEYRKGKFIVRASDEPDYKGLDSDDFEAAVDEVRRLFGKQKEVRIPLS